MLKPEKMSKLLVFGSKKDLPVVIGTLHKLKVYHIVEYDPSKEKDPNLDIGKPLSTNEQISIASIKARSLFTSWELAKAKGEKKKGHFEELKPTEIFRRLDSVHSEYSTLSAQLKESRDKIQALENAQGLVSVLKKLDINPRHLEGLNSVSCIVGSAKHDKIHAIRDSLNKAKLPFELHSAAEDKKSYIAIAIRKDKKEEALKILQNNQFNQIDFSPLASVKVENISKDISRLKNAEKDISEGISKLRKDQSSFIAYANSLLVKESEKSEAPIKFAASKNLFFVTGFVPKKDVENLIEELEHSTSERIHIEQEKIDKHDNVPVKLDNPDGINSFEFLLDMYSLPKYSEFDPTFLTFITFPILFGFMLGDIGYGLVTLILFIILRMAMPSAKKFMNIFIVSAVWTIAFGFAFGEFFGLEELGGNELPHLIHRMTSINEMLVIAIIVGIVHLNMGYFIGFYNEWKNHGFKAAFLEKMSWVMLEISIALIAAAIFLKMFSVWYGAALGVLSVYLIYKGEGLKGIVELPSLLSNILSYSRLMAIGLASAGLAVVVNEFAFEMFHAGIGGIIGGVLILLFGHLINFALGMLGPFLHSLRLHYVEFFTKFYSGGGQRFRPFGEDKE